MNESCSSDTCPAYENANVQQHDNGAERFPGRSPALRDQTIGQTRFRILICPAGAKAAAVFTTNKIVSAAVTVSKEHIKSPGISAVVVNSGNANACTGEKGIKNAIAVCRKTAQKLKVENRKHPCRFHRHYRIKTGLCFNYAESGERL